MPSHIEFPEEKSPATSLHRQPLRMWVAPGIVLTAIFAAIALISPQFAYEKAPLSRPLLLLVSLLVAAGAIYLRLVLKLRQGNPGNNHGLFWLILAGLVLRLILIPSTPIMEDDFYRYLWDGAVVAHGMNPYAYSPSEVRESTTTSDPDLKRMQQLAIESGPLFSRINHPEVRSIYPPAAQGVFALAYWIHPWSLLTWRIILLFFDILTLALLIRLLRLLNVGAFWSLVYWWNPLLIFESFNTAHMDILLFPILMGVLLCVAQKRFNMAGGLLGLATGIKIWPLLLLPALLRAMSAPARKRVIAGATFCLVAVGCLAPLLLSGIDNRSGLMAYGQSWEGNDSFFRLLREGTQALLPVFQVPVWHSYFVSRMIVVGLFALWMVVVLRRRSNGLFEFSDRCALLVAAVFLMSPTQYPWYFLWLLPFLSIVPRGALLSLTAFLPLYYLRFYFDARHRPALFDAGIVWLEFVPVWFLIIREGIQEWKNPLRVFPGVKA